MSQLLKDPLQTRFKIKTNDGGSLQNTTSAIVIGAQLASSLSVMSQIFLVHTCSKLCKEADF